MNNSPSAGDRKRLLWLSLGIFFLFTILIVQFYRIQIIEGDHWTKVAYKQHYFVVKEPFKRGSFFSNTSIKKGHPEKPQPLVIDVLKYHLYVDPASIPEENRNEISNHLLALLDHLSVDERLHFYSQFEHKSRSRKLAMWLDQDMHELILNWWHPYSYDKGIPRNALYFVKDYQRSYPFSKLLGQVLHTIQSNKNEETMQALPTGGLELYYNSLLQGKLGKRRLMRSPRHSLEIDQMISQPENGADIYLTVNHYIQAIAEEELARGVKKAKAKSGWAIMMDPKTGEILAWAQYPFFYPHDYSAFFNDSNLIENTRVKGITDANEPGSVMKPLTIAVALLANEELERRRKPKLFDPEDKMATANGRFPGRSKPIKDGTHVHPYLNLDMAIQHSSNIYVARLAEKLVAQLGAGWYRKTLEDVFAFSEKTGVELPSESRGVLPTPGKKHPNGTFEWSTPTPYSLSFGHNVQLTSLQLVRAYAVLANGGFLVKPTLVRKIIKKDSKGNEFVILDNTGKERITSFPRVLSEYIVKRVVSSMKFTTKMGGTARRADLPGFTEAGKTGTAHRVVDGRYSETSYVPTFIGFAPLSDPLFVLLVSIEEPEYGYQAGVGRKHHGGICAAPIFREIGKRTLEYLGVAPDDPNGYPVGDPRYNPDKADWVKETRRLQEKYDSWNSRSEAKS
jgi:cell division protein FtsI (penicillin-binding protein 3)